MDVFSGIGTVYTWELFPNRRDDIPPKRAWLIYLNIEPFGAGIIEVLITTTNPFYTNSLLLSSEDTPFPQDCFINFDDKPTTVWRKQIQKCIKDIHHIGSLNNEYLKKIYGGILRSDYYNGKQVERLYDNLISIGIDSIVNPTRRKRINGQIVIDYSSNNSP